MFKYITYINSFYKVMYDKATDYLTYYTKIQNNETNEDTVSDYDGILQIQKYTDETTNNRIYPQHTYYDTYSVFFDEPTFIIDNIYLGSAFNAASYDCLISYDIKLVINVTSEITNYYPDTFSYLRYDLYDNNNQSIEKYLEDAYQNIIEFQKDHDGNIFIHCYMGASRSASLVIYYLMKKYKYSFDDALEYIKSKRHIINPTFRFTKDLAKSIIKTY